MVKTTMDQEKFFPGSVAEISNTKELSSHFSTFIDQPLDLRIKTKIKQSATANVKVEPTVSPRQPWHFAGGIPNGELLVPKASLLQALLNCGHEEGASDLVIDCDEPAKKPRDRKTAYRTRSVKPHKCTHCQKRFSYCSNLEKHTRIHEKEKQYICPKCGIKFLKKCSLNKHSWKVCSNNGESGTRTECRECGMVFEDGLSLKNHLRFHKWERRANCSKCQEARKDKVVVEGQEIKCKECGKKLTKRQPNSPGGSQPQKCEKCGKTFQRLANLKKHLAKKHGLLPTESSALM